MEKTNKALVHKTFEIGIFLKGFNGLLEIIGGLLLAFTSSENINKALFSLTKNQLQKNPNNFFANLLVTSVQDFTGSGKLFGIVFLLSHGIIKLFLIIALFKRKLWAYPLAIIVFSLFILYQMYSYFSSFSIWLLLLSVLDVFVIWLTYMEYKNLKAQAL